MPDSFVFVDGLNASRADKKELRRHVMKGKNVGKTLHRPSRLGLHTKRANHSASSKQLRSEGGLENALGTLRLPVSITADAVEVVNEFFASTAERIYPIHLGISLEEAKRTWLRVLFTDEPAYHCNIAIMRACNDMFDSRAQSSRALQHLSNTFSHVQKIIGGDAALSDSSIAIVLSLIIQELIRNHKHDAAIHIQGLTRMIELRGGLDSLQENRTLMLKVCKIDIMFAIQSGGPTMYFRQEWPSFPAPSIPSTRHLDISKLRDDLGDTYHDTMVVCSLFNDSTYTMDLHTFEEVATSLCYRLLRFRSIHEGLATMDYQSYMHLGLLILTMTTFLKYGGRQIMDFPLVPDYLSNTVEASLGNAFPPKALWLCLLGGIWLSDGLGRNWLESRTAEISKNLSLTSWKQVQQNMEGLPWIRALHDEPGREFWESATSSNNYLTAT